MQEKYLEIVYKSRLNESEFFKIGAANSISILNLSNYSFSGKDLSGIRIPGADLAGGEFVKTNFTNADLTGVNLRSTLLTKAKFFGTIMANIELGILPSIIYKEKATFMIESPKN